MSTLLIKNATVINEGIRKSASIYIKDGIIIKISDGLDLPTADTVIDASGKLVLPGVIDDQVHFREPGLTHKGTIESESAAAVAGGITSFMEMPNTTPQATTQVILEEKYQLAAQKSSANFSFYMGATNDNIDELLKTDPKMVCGIKIFMGSSTGNMLVDNTEVLGRIFAESKVLIATHCEDEETIRKNTEVYKEKYGEDMPFKYHPEIRSEEACYLSSQKAAALARKHNSRLHILHLTTAKELDLLDSGMPLSERQVTGEVCVHHLWFSDEDYDQYGANIKWNPSIKTKKDRDALRQGLIDGRLVVVATDHAPHTKEEKANKYFKAPSGGPLVQHALVAMLEMVKNNIFTYELVVERMCHAPAELFKISKRGYLREGYFADIVIVNPDEKWEVNSSNLLYRCGWSPFDGTTFSHKVTHTIVNGQIVYQNNRVSPDIKGQRLTFER